MQILSVLIIGVVIGVIVANIMIRCGISILKLRYDRSKNKQKIYKIMLDSGKDIMYYFEVYPEKRFTYLSPALQNILGWKASDNLNNPTKILKMVHPDDYELLLQKYSGEVDYSKPIFMRFKHKNGQYIWTEDYAVPIYKGNKLMAITGCIRDITLRKELEEIIEYKSHHDPMTGIYNRQYFEWIFERLDKHKNARTAILLCELRGIKHLNNEFGLQGGNDFIKFTAEFLKEFSTEDCMLFRISGDEFAFIMMDVEERYVKNILDKIQKELNIIKENEKLTSMDMSLGYGYTLSSLGRMAFALSQAMDMVHKNKESVEEVKI